ncbi:phenoloxidase-activating factor 2-like [Lutzomyia longipalpis]|uniref:phenoloxidase-activating factor 2-like n=1 Tax=Lutzomyia longipalpis TaxID=7200 RepID=UPI002484489B|nr:phenoloxidase-activating factor 2-like [Lutzomyia longipalpis]
MLLPGFKVDRMLTPTLSFCLTMLARALILITIVAPWCALAQVSGQFWWLNPNFTTSLAQNRSAKRIESTVKRQEILPAGDCSCVLKCQCNDPPVDFVFDSDENSRESCALPTETCCNNLRLPIPANCSSASRFTDNTLEDRAPQSLNEFPWLLSLSIQRFPDVCGAAILTPTAAITAAHCVTASKYPTSYSIRTTMGHERILSEIIKHNGYYSGGRFNDIAIIKWDKALIIPQYANTIQLAQEVDIADEDTSCFAIELNSNRPSVPLNVMSPDLCEAVLKEGRLGKGFQLHISFLCAVTDFPGTCKAQGGNLLVCQRHGGAPLLAGVASWGFKCNEPRIFTDVSVFENWIEENLISFTFE